MTAVPAAAGPHPKRPELRALTGLRAVAAIAVVLSHTGVPKNAPTFLKQLAAWGHIGVPLFFLLSGLVLAYNYPHLTIRQGRRTVLFYIARIARVMPLYWVMIAYCVLFYYAVDHVQYPRALLMNIFAVQTWSGDVLIAQSRYNGPGWSIGVELFFYALFPFLAPLIAKAAARWRARGLVTIVVACAAISLLLWWIFVVTGRAALPAADPGSAHRWLYRNPLPHLTEFVAGMALAHLLPHIANWRPRTHHLLQGAVVAYTVLLSGLHPDGNAAFGSGSFGAFFLAPFALGILSLGSGLGWFARFLSTRVMVTLGTASYALYLTHRWFVWQLSTGEVIPKAQGYRGWVGVIVTVAVLLVIAEGAHRYIENPARAGIMRLARRILPARPAAAARPSEGAADATATAPTTAAEANAEGRPRA